MKNYFNFRKISRIMERLLQPLGCVHKKSRKTAYAHAKEIILVEIWIIIKTFVNWISPSTAVMDYSRCFPQFKIVHIFLKYFFQNISQMTLPNVYSISVENKTTEMNEMKHNEEKLWALPNS